MKQSIRTIALRRIKSRAKRLSEARIGKRRAVSRRPVTRASEPSFNTIGEKIIVVSRHNDIGEGRELVHRAGGQLKIDGVEVASPLAEEIPRCRRIARNDDGQALAVKVQAVMRAGMARRRDDLDGVKKAGRSALERPRMNIRASSARRTFT